MAKCWTVEAGMDFVYFFHIQINCCNLKGYFLLFKFQVRDCSIYQWMCLLIQNSFFSVNDSPVWLYSKLILKNMWSTDMSFFLLSSFQLP